MQEGALENQLSSSELIPLNVIRVETGLSRFPVHRLAKQGTIDIEIRERSDDGELLIRWEVDSSRKHGQPGPLAYKLDTLIVNRRIEETSRPIPKIIRLGSLTGIIEELGLSNHDTQPVRKALYQNAFAGITAKLRYTLADGRKKELEAGFTRYSVVFTGEELPDGRKADAVYLVLNEIFMQVINGAQTRPLDYDYLRDLPPASQRLYEILSYQMYAALKHGRPRARLSYAEFCSHAPLTRHLEWLRVRTQMNKLHAPHKKSGYIRSVEFEQTADRDGKPDWSMLYTPGPKARAEFLAFDKKGGPKTLVIEQSPPALISVSHQVEPTPLEQELVSRGMRSDTAAEIVASYPEEQILRQVEHFDWLKKNHPKSITKSQGGFLNDAIRRDYPTPPGFETRAQKAARDEEKREEQRRDNEAARKERQATARGLSHRAQVEKYLASQGGEELKKLDQMAFEHATPEQRAAFEQMPLESMKSLHLRIMRETYVRVILGLPKVSDV